MEFSLPIGGGGGGEMDGLLWQVKNALSID